MENSASTIAQSLESFIATYGPLKVRTYAKAGFVGILCIAKDGTETFLSTPRQDGDHPLKGFPYGGDKQAVKAFLVTNRDDLRVIDGESVATGNAIHTLCFSNFTDDTEDVF